MALTVDARSGRLVPRGQSDASDVLVVTILLVNEQMREVDCDSSTLRACHGPISYQFVTEPKRRKFKTIEKFVDGLRNASAANFATNRRVAS